MAKAKRSQQSRKTEATMINVAASEARDAALAKRIDGLEGRMFTAFGRAWKRDEQQARRIATLEGELVALVNRNPARGGARLTRKR